MLVITRGYIARIFAYPSPLAEAFLTGTPDPAAAAAFKKQPLDWTATPWTDKHKTHIRFLHVFARC